MSDDGDVGQLVGHSFALGKDDLDPLVFDIHVVESLGDAGLREAVDVVGVLDVVEEVDDLLGGESHAATDASESPRLGERLEDDEVGMLVEAGDPRGLGSEIYVGLIDDNNALEGIEDALNLLLGKEIARRIVGRAEPDDLGLGIGGSEDAVGLERVFGPEIYGAILDIVDIRLDAVHAVGGLDGDDIVEARTAEDSIDEVDRLIGAVAEHELPLSDALEGSDAGAYVTLEGVGIAVEPLPR